MSKTFLGSFAIVVLLGTTPVAQEPAKSAATNGTPSTTPATPAINITPDTTPKELARAAFMAQGGEKFRAVQNMTLRGSVKLYPPNSVQSLPGAFSLTTAGEKLRLEIDARPAFVVTQIYDGERTYSSMPNIVVPPLTKFGWGALARFDQPGYEITALPDKKKQRAFRIVDPDGYTTDYFIDPKTGRVMTFLLYFNELTLGTDTSQFKEMDGVLIPFNFSQRFEMAMGAFFAEFSVKEAKLNQQLGPDAFAIPH
ncbi:MAG TPA: hypothetical protein VIK76_03450 [Pyrinomonadaceae bacterium]|jgi:hypothetical protein